MVGPPGSGKTFFADKFAETFGAPYIRFDAIAKLAKDTTTVDSLVDYQLKELLKTRLSIIIENNIGTRASRAELTKKAKAAGYETLLIWVQTDPLTAKSRLTSGSHAVSSDAYDQRAKRFAQPTPSEKSIVISGKHTYATQAKVVLTKLSTPRAEISTHKLAPARVEPSGRRNITIR